MLGELWQQNRGYIYTLAKKLHNPDSRVREIDDFMQEGFFGLCKAAEKFDPQKGVVFIAYAGYWIRQAMQRSITNGRRRADIIESAVSLDEPLTEADGLTLADTIIDDEAEKTAIAGDISRIVRAKVRELPDRQREVIYSRWLTDGGERMTGIDDRKEEKRAFRTLAKDNELREIMGFRHKSLKRFRQTWMSAVEDEVIRRERRKERLLG